MEKRGAACEEEAEMDSHRVMGKERRLWEIWCKGLALSNGNRLAFLPTALHPGEETGGGLKCNSSKWEEQRAKWKEDETKRVPVHAHGGFGAHAPLCSCLYVFKRRDYHCQKWSLSISATPAHESPAIVSYHSHKWGIRPGLDQPANIKRNSQTQNYCFAPNTAFSYCYYIL